MITAVLNTRQVCRIRRSVASAVLVMMFCKFGMHDKYFCSKR